MMSFFMDKCWANMNSMVSQKDLVDLFDVFDVIHSFGWLERSASSVFVRFKAANNCSILGLYGVESEQQVSSLALAWEKQW